MSSLAQFVCCSVGNARVGPPSRRSTQLLSFAMLPAPHILKGSSRGVRGHQPIGHPLVDQGGVRGHSTQQHGEASVQHLTDATTKAQPQQTGTGRYVHLMC